jgi:hypothetical protein
MMRRTGFKPKWPAKPVTTTARAPMPSAKPDTSGFRLMQKVSDSVAAMPKENAVRSESYRRLVAALPCMQCGIHGYSQAAHPNAGKGMAIKADDRLCFPLCTVHPNAAGQLVEGCHALFDQHAMFTKYTRQVIEEAMASDTRKKIIAMGDWPKDLPVWQ